MFEIGIISIVVLAVGYWVTLWLMGRHDDVLHGDFVHTEEGVERAASAFSVPRLQSGPSFPVKPPSKPLATEPSPPLGTKPPVMKASLRKPSPIKVSRIKPAAAKPEAAKPSPAATLPESPAPSRADRLDTLEALLASIKRDLKDASQL